MKLSWFDATICPNAPKVCLCLNSKSYRKAMKAFGINNLSPWLATNHADAATHFCISKSGETGAVICLKSDTPRAELVVFGLLVHEAVHVWQNWCDHVGELSPGAEQEAYAIQAIAQELMAEYRRQRNG